MQANDMKGARTRARAAVANLSFSSMPEEARRVIWMILAITEQDDEPARALLAARELTASSEASGIDWHLRLGAAYGAGDYADAADSLRTIADRWPQTLGEINDRPIFRLIQEAGAPPESSARRVQLLEALFIVDWKPTEPFADGSGVWLDLVQARLEKGDTAGALAAAERLRAPDDLIALRADRRFDVLTRPDVSRFDPRGAAEAHLASDQALAAEKPRLLAGVNTVAEDLLKLGRAADALAWLDAALAKVAKSRKAFDDLEELIWTQDYRVRALWALGRVDEALDEEQRAARRPERGSSNVSQVINLSGYLYLASRPQEALKALEALDGEVSPYGQMQADEVRVCALAQAGDMVAARALVASMQTRIKDAPNAVLNVQLCVDDREAVAKTWIALLADPEQRREALVGMQDYRPRPATQPFERLLIERRRAVRDRPDVAAAVAAVGRIERYDLTGPLT